VPRPRALLFTHRPPRNTAIFFPRPQTPSPRSPNEAFFFFFFGGVVLSSFLGRRCRPINTLFPSFPPVGRPTGFFLQPHGVVSPNFPFAPPAPKITGWPFLLLPYTSDAESQEPPPQWHATSTTSPPPFSFATSNELGLKGRFVPFSVIIDNAKTRSPFVFKPPAPPFFYLFRRS